MRARVPWKPTKTERQTMKAEINRQVVKANEEYANDIDAVILWVLHTQPDLRFGRKRLRRFWESFRAAYKELIDFYEMPNDGGFLAKEQLKKIGVDIEAWNKEEI